MELYLPSPICLPDLQRNIMFFFISAFHNCGTSSSVPVPSELFILRSTASVRNFILSSGDGPLYKRKPNGTC